MTLRQQAGSPLAVSSMPHDGHCVACRKPLVTLTSQDAFGRWYEQGECCGRRRLYVTLALHRRPFGK